MSGVGAGEGRDGMRARDWAVRQPTKVCYGRLLRRMRQLRLGVPPSDVPSLGVPPVSGCVRALAGRLWTSWPPT